MIKIKGNGTIKDFKMHKYQVTQKKFEHIMGYNPSYFRGDNFPVENLTWYDALMYCNKLSEKKKLTKYYDITNIIKNGNNITDATVAIIGGEGYRLPTDKEWLWAAKGGKKSQGYVCSGSNSINKVAWYEINSGREARPVGEKKPNKLGLYDMTGNIWEWNDAVYEDSLLHLRGGSLHDFVSICSAAHRNFSLGFRVCRSIIDAI